MTDASRELDEFLGAVESLLDGARRAEAAATLAAAGRARGSLSALRRALRAHAIPGEHERGTLARLVQALDGRTREEGLHVLHGWDFRAQTRPRDTAAVLLVDLCEQEVASGLGPADRAARLLIDHYVVGLLSLAAVRAWDAHEPGAVLDRITRALATLHGPGGAPWAAVRDGESLLMLAVAYYHPEEAAYDRQLSRVQTLGGANAVRFAHTCAAVMGSHLRWGLRFMYGSDIGRMRADNVIDYPWLLYALLILAREHRRLADASTSGAGGVGDRQRVADALVDGLSPDPWAFDGPAPAFLGAHGAAHAEVRTLLDAGRADLVAVASERRRGYSPTGLSCNFIANAVVASVVTAVGAHERTPPLSALFAPGGADVESYATSLMGWAAARPERLGAGGVPLVVYDRRDAAHFSNVVTRTLRERMRPAT